MASSESISGRLKNLLVVKKLSKAFGGIKALDDVNLSIKPEQITALIGPNGSGKTTLFNIISRLLKEDKGDLFINNKSVFKSLKKLDPYQVARLGISRTFQQVRLLKNLTIRDHFVIVFSQNNESLLNSIIKEEDYDGEIVRIMRLIGLEKPLDTVVSELSYGQRKLLDLGLAIAKPHNVLLLDEPVAGVNPRLRDVIKRILLDLKKNKETIIIIEHDMNFVMSIADEVFVLDAGKVIAHGSPEEVMDDKKVLEAYLGD